jgi:GNAT superfamily N-acetyltransferase
VIPAGASYVEVDNLYVSPALRNAGIGRAMVSELLDRARMLGVTHALLYSATKKLGSILRFYERHDFKSWCVQMFQ